MSEKHSEDSDFQFLGYNASGRLLIYDAYMDSICTEDEKDWLEE